ncbi:hypothetical protein ACOSQ4_024637 [Xanthoceras sorbifolium]
MRRCLCIAIGHKPRLRPRGILSGENRAFPVCNQPGPEKQNQQFQMAKYLEEFSIPSSVVVRIPRDGELASGPEPDSMTFHPAFLEVGFRLPLQPFLKRVLREIEIALAQLNPNGWRILVGIWSLWKVLGIISDPSLREIQHYYRLLAHTKSGDGW